MTERGLKNINFFIQRLQTFFLIFVTFFTFFNVLYFFMERFYIYDKTVVYDWTALRPRYDRSKSHATTVGLSVCGLPHWDIHKQTGQRDYG